MYNLASQYTSEVNNNESCFGALSVVFVTVKGAAQYEFLPRGPLKIAF